MDEVTLLPCPFCGRESLVLACPFEDDEQTVVRCIACNADGPHWGDDESTSNEEAASLWNKRATPPQEQSARDRLLEIVKSKQAVYQTKLDACDALGPDDYNRHGVFKHTVEAFDWLLAALADDGQPGSEKGEG